MPAAKPMKVLVALDGSNLAEHAIPFAYVIAGKRGSVTFFTAIDPDHYAPAAAPEEVYGVEALQAAAGDASAQFLAETLGRTAVEGYPQAQVMAAPGDPATAIMAAAQTIDADLIAIATRGQGALKRLAHGSVADRVARESDVPVLVVNPPGDGSQAVQDIELKRVVVPIDGSDTARAALPVAARIAKSLKLPVVLVEAVNPSQMMVPAAPGMEAYPAELYDSLAAELAEAAAESLEEAKDAIGGKLEISRVVMQGPPATVIEGVVEPGDLIVMASNRRGGISRWVLGSVAEQLVRAEIAPVLLVPAEDTTPAE